MQMVKDRIKEIISNEINCEEMGIEITDDTDLFEDLAVDSILIIQLISEFEQTFGIEFDYELDYESISKIGKLAEYINSKMLK